MAIDRDEIRSTVTQRYGAKAERALAGAVPLAGFLESLGAAVFVNARADAVRDLDGYVGLASALISAEKPA